MSAEAWDLVQIGDDPKDEHGLGVEFACFEPNSYGDAMFITIRCRSGERFFGQIEGTQLNLNRDSLGKYDNAAFNQFEELRHGRLDAEQILKLLSLYKIRLIKDVSGNVPLGIRRRPLAGSVARMATDNEATSALSLPSFDPRTVLGSVLGTDLALCLNERVLINHIGVAGSTGSGKSNLIANVIRIALALGFYVIVYDHKPDYYRSDQPNDEALESYSAGLKNVTYWRLTRGQGRGGDVVLPASALDYGVLAQTLLYKYSEHRQAEEAERLLETYIGDVHSGDLDSPFGIADFFDWYQVNYQRLVQQLNLHRQTADALLRKLAHRGRRPSWIADYASGGTLGRAGMFDLASLAKPGHATVVDVRAQSSGQVGRSYALFLSYALREAGNLRANGCDFPILHVIDEAQDIFDASREFKEQAGGMMSDYIRKGRSQKIGFVIGVQAADSVPGPIRNNLNSEIVMRHRRPDLVREASAILSQAQGLQTATFGPGECFAYLAGASSVVRCQARRSPFRLPREDD